MITVLLPTYNCGAYITDAIKCILNQTFKEFELLIIDDGSNDNTEKKVLSYRDSRISYLKKKHTYLSDTLNFGLDKASFDIIARMDADDLCVPTRLQRQLVSYNDNPGENIVSCASAYFYSDKIKYTIAKEISSNDVKKGLLLHSYISHPGAMYNKNTILNNGGYKGIAFEDYELWLRIQNKVNFIIIPEILLFQRLRHNSQTKENLRKKVRIHYDIQKSYYETNLRNYGVTSNEEENIYRGWREYFYGDLAKARTYWGKNITSKNLRIMIAYLLSYSPKFVLDKFKRLSIRYRLEYIVRYFAKENLEIRKNLKLLLNSTIISD
jgi:glycosyltransferase involved in cell wall biosynthesis